MRADRLLKLADFLEIVREDAFNLSDWKVRDAAKPEGGKPGDCGFIGCAVGWAVHQKMFRGLRFGRPIIESPNDIYYKPSPKAYKNHGWAAVTAVFDIDRYEADHLFDKYEYRDDERTSVNIAKRIRKFVKDKQVSA